MSARRGMDERGRLRLAQGVCVPVCACICVCIIHNASVHVYEGLNNICVCLYDQGQ